MKKTGYQQRTERPAKHQQRRSKEQPTVTLTIEKMGINGEGIGYLDRIPVFVDGAFPAEVVKAAVISDEKTYKRAKLLSIEQASMYRINERYPLYHGHPYALVQVEVSEQLRQKRELVCQALWKYAGIPSKLVEETVENPVPFGYRNQCKMPFGYDNGKIVTGMYLPNSNYFVPVKHDIIHEPALEEMRVKILEIINRYDYQVYDKKQKKGLRTLVLRHFDGLFQCTLVTGKDHISHPMVEEIMALPGMAGVAHSINTSTGPDVFGRELKMLSGEMTLPVRINDLTLQVSCRSFFQLNTVQAARLYQLVHDLLSGRHYRRIIEAYSGVGGLGLSVADLADEVIGIENISSAVKNASENAKRNGIKNAKFVLGDAGSELRRLAESKKHIDAVIVDPPRVGLSEEFLITLLKTLPDRIVYVSCNPSTLGKDLSVLKDRYDVKRVIPLDMFTHTAHVECVVLLEKK